ncbi:MAG TPA: hypothetical protein VIV12_06315 [Streptosporangiaceae bacterium]
MSGRDRTGVPLPAATAHNAGAGSLGEELPAPVRTWTVELPAGQELLSANDRAHGYERRHRLNTEWINMATVMVRKRGVPRLQRATVTAEYRMPDRKRRDIDNLAPTVKACIDGIIAAGVLRDDSWLYLPELRIVMTDAREWPGRLVLHITELEP